MIIAKDCAQLCIVYSRSYGCHFPKLFNIRSKIYFHCVHRLDCPTLLGKKEDCIACLQMYADCSFSSALGKQRAKYMAKIDTYWADCVASFLLLLLLEYWMM